MKLRGRVILGVAAAASLAAMLAAPAGGRIVLQRGIAGVSLQMTRDQVRAVLGKPRGVKNARNTVGRYIDYRYPGLLVRFQGLQTATMISTSRRTERTAHGIGVGSTKAQVKSKVAGVHCRFILGARFCYAGQLLPGRRVTTFYFNDRNRVNRVAVGLVVD
jgi:hypothetical protein